MSHSLSKKELREILCYDALFDSSGFRWLELAMAWQEEVVLFDYLLAQILEDVDDAVKRQRIMFRYFEIEQFYSTREDFGLDFVDYVLRHLRDRGLTLEEELLYHRDRMAHHAYDRALRL